MLLQLKDVFLNDGRRLSVDYSLPLSELELNGDYPFKSPVEVCAEAVNRAGLVELSVKTVFDYTTRCDRCFEEIVKHMHFTFKHRLAVELIDDENDDYIETPDYNLELDQLVESDIILNLPGKMLCKDDCRGLCPQCGQNLNSEQCRCSGIETDPRLEILNQLLH